jgi:DNA-binding PucR family transcriptional regulator
MELGDMRAARVAAGQEGLHRVIIWYSVRELPIPIEDNLSDKLIFISGVGLKEPDRDLLNMTRSFHEGGAAGVVFEVGEYIRALPPDVLDYANRNAFAVIELPYKVSVGQVTYGFAKRVFANTDRQNGINECVETLMNNEDSEEAQRRLGYYGFDSSHLYCGAVVKPDGDGDKNVLYKILYSFASEWNRRGYENVFAIIRNDAVVLLSRISHSKAFKGEIIDIFDGVRQSRAFSALGVTVNMGVGGTFSAPSGIAKSIGEAYKAYNLIVKCGGRNEVRIYEDIGVYQLFYEFCDNKDLRDVYYDTLGQLIERDGDEDACLLQTLEKFLDCGCSITLTAQFLNIHRNTVKYRVARIREIMKLDFTDVNRCFHIRFAYKIKKHLQI